MSRASSSGHPRSLCGGGRCWLREKQISPRNLTGDDGGLIRQWAGDIPVVVLNQKFPLVRKRLTALLELAHLLVAFPKGQFDHKQVEQFCHAFAGAMLMPEENLAGRPLAAFRASLQTVP